MTSAPFRVLAWRMGGRTVLGLLAFCCCIAPAPAQRWIDNDFDDFIQGNLDASGHNLYVSRDGKVQSINRFDLNQDGFLDLVFNNNHDWYYWILATLGTVGADRQIRESELAVLGSARVIAHDLNLNGRALRGQRRTGHVTAQPLEQEAVVCGNRHVGVKLEAGKAGATRAGGGEVFPVHPIPDGGGAPAGRGPGGDSSRHRSAIELDQSGLIAVQGVRFFGIGTRIQAPAFEQDGDPPQDARRHPGHCLRPAFGFDDLGDTRNRVAIERPRFRTGEAESFSGSRHRKS